MKLHSRIALQNTLVVLIVLAAVSFAAVEFFGMPYPIEKFSAILLCIALAVVVSFVVFYFLAYHSLRQVRDIVKEVEKITEQHIHKRLPIKNAKDDVGKLAIAFNELLGRMEQSLEAQRMFVSNVSHEMRTPLAAIIAELDLALQKERSAQEYASTINDALYDAHRMNRLIDGLLNLAKASYHKEEIKKKPIRLDELLLDARANLLKAHPDYRIELIFEEDNEDDDRLITVNANAYLLTIALTNLIENNCKYSADKTSFIQISFWESLTIVRLSDSGIGMSADDKEHLFTLFYRGKQDKEENNIPGHGIGMALAHRIVTLHDGTIHVYSEEGKGTTFLVELPHV